MKYEIVKLEARTIAGKSIVTSNEDPKMGEKIGALWFALYNPIDGYYGAIENRANECAVGLYSDYLKDGSYIVTVGAEVTAAAGKNFETKTIPAGKYAKFSVHGNMVADVAKAWGEIWSTDLNRTFTGDFEEYQPCKDCDRTENCNIETCRDCDIDIYVAIK